MSDRSRGQKPEWQLKIAKQRIHKLFEQAEEIVQKDRALAERYIYLARKIGMRYNVRIPKELRAKFCRHCHAFLKDGISADSKQEGTILSMKCRKCGKVTKRAV